MAGTETLVSALPECDFCKSEGNSQEAHYDGATGIGPWAYMCERHFGIWGIGLGTGVGQTLIVREGGENNG